jgi:hypothetical protein
VHSIRGAVSGDGIRWTKLPEPLVVEYSDTEIAAYYDPALRKYVMYTRYWSVGPRTDRLPPDIRHCWTGVERRSIGRSETSDFRRFPPSELLLEPPPQLSPSDVLYTNCRTTIPGAPNHHLMFPAIWHVDRDNTSIAVLSSHDGKVWHWTPVTWKGQDDLGHQEGKTLEFKRDASSPDNLIKTIVAFANGAGGILQVGVEDLRASDLRAPVAASQMEKRSS